MTPTDYKTIEAMNWHGGSFVRALAEAAACADPANLERLKAAFPEYWAKYAAMAEREAVKEVQDAAVKRASNPQEQRKAGNHSAIQDRNRVL